MGLLQENLSIMKKYNIKAQKKYGQNFLINEEILDKIIETADINNRDLVIEIGPGLGNLTKRLCAYAGHVLAIEIDTNMVDILNAEYSDLTNLTILNQDIMKVDLKEVIKDYSDKTVKVVANLPYYITTPIIMKLLEDEINIELIEVMIQEEVALRFCAKPSSKDYGAITLAINYYTEPSYVISAKAKEFLPSPDVDSAVVKMDIKKEKIEVSDKELLFKIIKASFVMRRKTLLNSLGSAGIMGVGKKELSEILVKLEISENVRAENLSLEEYVKITDYIHQRCM